MYKDMKYQPTTAATFRQGGWMQTIDPHPYRSSSNLSCLVRLATLVVLAAGIAVLAAHAFGM